MRVFNVNAAVAMPSPKGEITEPRRMMHRIRTRHHCALHHVRMLNQRALYFKRVDAIVSAKLMVGTSKKPTPPSLSHQLPLHPILSPYPASPPHLRRRQHSPSSYLRNQKLC